MKSLHALQQQTGSVLHAVLRACQVIMRKVGARQLPTGFANYAPHHAPVDITRAQAAQQLQTGCVDHAQERAAQDFMRQQRVQQQPTDNALGAMLCVLQGHFRLLHALHTQIELAKLVLLAQ